MTVVDRLITSGMCLSKSIARRRVACGRVFLNGTAVDDPEQTIDVQTDTLEIRTPRPR